MKEKKNDAKEVKKYQPGDVIEIYDGVKSKYGYGDTAFFMFDEETGVNSWECGIDGKRIEICVDKDDCHLTAQDMLDKYMPQYRTDEMVGILKDRATNPAADGFTPEQKETIEGYFGAYGNDSGRERAAGYVLARLESTVDESLRKSAGMSAAIEEFRSIGNVAPIQSQTTVRQEEDPKIQKFREQTAQYAIEHITGNGMHRGIRWLQDSFNDYYKAICTPGVKISEESDIAHRKILAQKVAIDCIHALNKEQLERLDKVLDGIAKDITVNNGLRR